MPDFTPAQPWRVETRLPPSKAATPRLTLVSRLTFHGPWEGSENAARGEARSARLGWAGEKTDFFSILLSSDSLHNHYTLNPCRVIDQLVESVPRYLADNPAHRTSLACANFHNQCAAGRQVSTRFL
jgi:hypothetical protein